MPDTLDGCKHFGPGRIWRGGGKEVRGRAVKGLRGAVVVHEVEGLAYLHRSPTGRTIARMCGGSGTSRSH